MRAVGIPSELIVNVCKPAGVVADRDVPAARTVAQREGGREEKKVEE